MKDQEQGRNNINKCATECPLMVAWEAIFEQRQDESNSLAMFALVVSVGSVGIRQMIRAKLTCPERKQEIAWKPDNHCSSRATEIVQNGAVDKLNLTRDQLTILAPYFEQPGSPNPS